MIVAILFITFALVGFIAGRLYELYESPKVEYVNIAERLGVGEVDA